MLFFTVIQPSKAGWVTRHTLPWHSVLTLLAVPAIPHWNGLFPHLSPLLDQGSPKFSVMCLSSKHLNIPTYVYICFLYSFLYKSHSDSVIHKNKKNDIYVCLFIYLSSRVSYILPTLQWIISLSTASNMQFSL